ncbi:cell division control protein 14 [Rhodotorula kratochvilovae]
MATSVASPVDPLARTRSTSRSLSPASALTDHDGDSIIEDAPVHHNPVNGVHPPANPGPAPAAGGDDLKPSGPICSFGPRLAFTYFASPAPRADLLNALTPGRPAGPGAVTGAEDEPAEEGVHWFSVDDQLVYLSFYQDYGPLNRIFLYSSDEPDKKVNAALLMALYAMVVMRWSVADVLHPLSCLELQPYRDAGYSRADYHLHPQSILYGVHRALSHQLLDLSTFDLVAYEAAEKVETGDWNWITPGFVAFASPLEAGWGAPQGATPKKVGGTGGKISRAFRNVLDEFESKGVKVVVRLNKKLYDAAHFTSRGMEHVEMYFDDGTNPTLDMCRRFIDLSDRVISAGGAVAVHCKAGLGRTGTLIGAYLIYKHGFTADEAIGFMRLMRPGSCVGPQQHFLYENQLEWVRWAARDALRAELAAQVGPAGVAALAPPAPAARARTTTPPLEEKASAAAPTTPGPGNVPPVTPRRTGGAVPGQPRKTPGRSRHAVAQPEEVSPQEKARLEAEAEEERMEGVVLSSPRKRVSDAAAGAGAKGKAPLRMEEALEGEDDDEEEDPLALVSPKKLVLAPAASISASGGGNAQASTSRAGATTLSTRPKTPSAAGTTTSSRPTRVPRPARPLSALADNRIVDRLASNAQGTRVSTRAGAASSSTAAGGAAGGLARSKAAKNLNTVFEAEGGQSRYPLRNTRSGAAAAAPQPPNSPTKLPQRVLGKRDAAPARDSSSSASSVASSAAASTSAASAGGFNPPSVPLGGKGGLGGRNVRRRRSSMGSQETVNAG